MTDDQFLLANAYFDNEVDARERTLAESDPIVMAEVDRLRALRNDLRDVPPASASTRAGAIEAALDAWTTSTSSSPATPRTTSTSTDSAEHSRSTPATPPTSLDAARAHRSSSRWATPSRLLGAAAALVAIGFGALVVTRGGGGESDDAAGAAVESSSYSYEAATADSAADYADSDSASAAADEASDAGLPPAVTTGGGANLADTQTPSVENSATSTTVPGSAGGAPPVTVTPLSTLQFTDDDLQILVDQFIERPGSNRAPPITYDCELATPQTASFVGYTNVLNSDNDRPTVTLFIMVDNVDKYAYAVDADTCLVVQALVLRP